MDKQISLSLGNGYFLSTSIDELERVEDTFSDSPPTLFDSSNLENLLLIEEQQLKELQQLNTQFFMFGLFVISIVFILFLYTAFKDYFS